MARIWTRRLRSVGVGLLAATLACLGLAGVLFAAGDSAGSQALCGAAVVAGFCFAADVGMLTFWSAAQDDTPAQNDR